MKVVLATLHLALLRNFRSVVEALAGRGHEVVLAYEEPDRMGGGALAADLSDRLANVRVADLSAFAADPVVDFGARLRVALDYFRFHEEPYRSAPKLRQRLQSRVPAAALRLGAIAGRGPAMGLLSAIESGLPVSDGLTTWLAAERPDVLLLGSLTHYRSLSPELQRAAGALGIPTAACIYSWDHLSSKAQLRRAPEAVFVWNPVQADEAVRLHAIPPDRVVVTGAQCYDQWYDRRPARDHAAFCREVGLDPDRPFLLYVCSALTPSPDEPGFVRALIAALRASADPALSGLGVLIRPHPERLREWADVSDLPANVVVRGGSPIDEAGRSEYFDALSHAEAVVGLVTSAFLEAAIVGRPVFTIALPAFASHQQDMQHFRYLLEVADGLPAVAASIDQHLAQLAAVLHGDTRWRDRQARFLGAFVRPHGDGQSATERFADAAEHLGLRAVPRDVAHWGTVAGRAALRVAGSRLGRRALRDELEARHARGLARKAATKRQKRLEKRRQQIGRLARRIARRPGSHGA